jgi:hypothetical protein
MDQKNKTIQVSTGDEITLKHVNVPLESNETEISLADLFLVLWRWKFLIILLTLLCFGGSVAGAMIQDANSATTSTIVEMRWEGITDGEYPDGQRFLSGNMFSANMYGQVIDTLGLSLNVNDVRRRIQVTPIVPSDIVTIIERGLQRGEQISYHPTSFRISLDHAAVGVTELQAQNILNELLTAFRLEFDRRYIQRTVVLDFQEQDFSLADYVIMLESLDSQLAFVRTATNSVLPEGNRFTSTTLGFGFNDILIRADLIESIQMNTMATRINNYQLTKDVDLLVSIYEFRIEQTQLRLDRDLEIQAGLEDLIENFVGNTNTIIIPGMDLSGQFSTDPYLNTLYANLVATQELIADHRSSINAKTRRIERLLGNDPSFLVTPEKQEEQRLILESELASTASEITRLGQDLEGLLSEYNDFVTRGFVSILAPAQIVSDVNTLLFAAIGTVLGGMIGVFAAFVIEYALNERSKRLNTN